MTTDDGSALFSFENPDHPALRLLEADESVHVLADASSARVLVTDRRLAVVDGERAVLNIAFPELRRIQFDYERERPATLVIVPEHPTNEAQVLTIPPERYDEITRALSLIGKRLADLPNPGPAGG